ncbi:LacI family transcriptional regulator [Opitutaceae bacterium TAV4]|nr:LacI family transcriptional regulator [Opitutaceae bacterium TAV4]RRJ98660.1 LacI family transcriptional regulator [Opitutaceae bacterium TAV3]
MNSKEPTYREIAQQAGVSIATVSFALRNRSKVSEATRRRIKAIAAKCGYRPNPMVTALMSQHRRRSARQQMRAIIVSFSPGWVPEKEGGHSTFARFRDGERAACDETGFILEGMLWGEFEESSRRVFSRLRARRVPGVVFRGGSVPEWCLSGWDNYAFSALGSPIREINAHLSMADIYGNAWLVMDELAALGYRRIGFVLNKSLRANHRALSAYMGWTEISGREAPAPLVVEHWERDVFLRWFEQGRPDALVVSADEPIAWLKEAGCKIPDEVGIAHLDLADSWRHLAGVRQNNFETGRAAVHLVIDQINRNVCGIPEHPRSVLIKGDWFAGPSVRRRK